MKKLTQIIILGIIICSIGFIIFNNPMGLSSASINPALEYKTYTQNDTVPCRGTYTKCTPNQWGGYGCYIAPNTGTQCYRVASGYNIILKSIDPLNDANGIYEYCPNGVYDPNPDNGIIEAKCLGYCKPGTRVCDGNILRVCNPDGTDTINTGCTLGCVNTSSLSTVPSCVLPHNPFGISLKTESSYLYGKDAVAQVSVIVDDRPYEGALIRGKIFKDGGIISETTAYTKEDGNANLVFSNVEGVGTAKMIVSATYIDKVVEVQKDIYFTGETLVFTSTTYSYIQYTAKPVEFTVEIKDIKGKYISPSMGNLSVISTMSNSNVLNNHFTYIGNGQYQVFSNVSGSGIYTGKVKMLYQGVEFESNGIQINIRDTTLEIDTSGIKPVALLGDTEVLRFSVMSSVGGVINPDDIYIDIQYPDGYTTDKLTKEDLYKVSDGVYEFTYKFNQLEKYTFNVYADKVGYTRGTSRMSIAVSSIEEEFNYVGFILSNIVWIFVIIIAASVILYRSRKK